MRPSEIGSKADVGEVLTKRVEIGAADRGMVEFEDYGLAVLSHGGERNE
jgi:hypothetical protein